MAKAEWDNVTKMRELFKKKAFAKSFDHSAFGKNFPINMTTVDLGDDTEGSQNVFISSNLTAI